MYMKDIRLTKKYKGFTLIELLVVIAIIGILAGLVMVNMAGVRERARDTQRKSELNEVKKALRLYYNDNSRYPAEGTGNTIAPSSPISWGSPFIVGTMTYMKQLPTDPLSGQQYAYYWTVGCGNDEFRLEAILENASDPDIVKSKSRCTDLCDLTAGTNSYVVCPD